jgi:pyruvate dehydrogenase E2 component (dihydrolipoamide acetyltransferase)
MTSNETLNFADRWMRDGLHVLRPPFSAMQISVDMTNALRRLEDLRSIGVHASTTHLLVRATARALAANPELHQIVAGVRRLRPGSVDIGLSVAGDSFVAPVLVIENAAQKSIAEIAAEIARRALEVREADRRMLSVLRRWGWLLPFGFMRRALLRTLFRSPSFRRKGAGTFQVSTVPVDWALSSCFSTAGVLIGGQVWSSVVAINGQPVVRPIMKLTLSSDHGVWDGRAATRFMAAVKSELEREEAHERHQGDDQEIHSGELSARRVAPQPA